MHSQNYKLTPAPSENCFAIFLLRVRSNKSIISGSSTTTTPSQHAAEENRQAIMLFAIVILFFICNVPRNFLSLHEALTFKQKKEDYFHGCGGMPLWILAIGLISHLLLTCNSAFNFFLYCAMSDQFRNELKKLISFNRTPETVATKRNVNLSTNAQVTLITTTAL
jgi:hypothetical protein